MGILKSVERNYVLLLRDRDLMHAKLKVVQDVTQYERETYNRNGDWFIAGCLGPCAATTAETSIQEWESLRKIKYWKNLVLIDAHKGLERIGRHIGKQRGVQWREYWAFMDSLCDISCADGLKRFESYLQHRPEFDFLSLIGNPYSPTPQHLKKIRFSNHPVKSLELDSVKLRLKLDDDEEEDEQDHKSANEYFFDCFDQLSDKFAALRTDNDEDEEELSYRTPPQSPTAFMNSQSVFIRSSGPTKEDFDVFNVLESVEIDAKLYPTANRWKKFVGLYQDSERQHWPPLDSPRVKTSIRTNK